MKSLFRKLPAGFTLVEFIVILVIFSIMAAVALVNFTGFRSNIGLNNLAQDIALTVRQAQVFGWSTITTGDLDPVLDPVRRFQGVSFMYDGPNSRYKQEIILYEKDSVATGDTGNYQMGNANVRDIDTVKIQGPYVISEIKYAATKQEILDGGGTSIGDDVSIAFSRPRPEPLFYKGESSLAEIVGTQLYVGIIVKPIDDANAKPRIVIISQTGEIGVQ